jgi:hypothetical protein
MKILLVRDRQLGNVGDPSSSHETTRNGILWPKRMSQLFAAFAGSENSLHFSLNLWRMLSLFSTHGDR